MSALELVIGGSLILFGVILVILSLSALRGKIKGEGAVLIGPFPIIFGGGAAGIVAIIFIFFIFFALFLLMLGVGGVRI